MKKHQPSVNRQFIPINHYRKPKSHPWSQPISQLPSLGRLQHLVHLLLLGFPLQLLAVAALLGVTFHLCHRLHKGQKRSTCTQITFYVGIYVYI
jgi:hypothetical protein